MTHSLYAALRLCRVFDSRPPEKQAFFYDVRGARLFPQLKPGGLYVFIDMPLQPITVCCGGYQTETVTPEPGEVISLRLYPDKDFLPPCGWALVAGQAPAGRLCFWPDLSCRVRVIEAYGAKTEARLRFTPGLLGGCIGFSEGRDGVAMILDKTPPDIYRLDAAWPSDGCGVCKGYAGRSQADGICVAVVPTGFAAGEATLVPP